MPSRTTARSGGQTAPLYVRRIRVEGLFGQFNYDLRPAPGVSGEPSKLMILYGDNGSGKTTLLRMLFHLLHPASDEGHRSFIGRCVFSRFEVALGDGIRVIAARPEGETSGPFRMVVKRRGKTAASIDWLINADGDVSRAVQGEERQAEFMRQLASLRIALYYLGDNRRMETASITTGGKAPEGRPEAELRLAMYKLSEIRHGWVPRVREHERPTALEIAVQRASDWVVQQVLRASTKGDEDANAIYTEIIKRIARPKPRGLAEKAYSKRGLISEVHTLAERALAFARYGLIAPTDANALIASVQGASPTVLPTIQDVVRPYLDGLRARLDALQKVHDRIDAFVSVVNGFYSHKRLAFHLRDGLTIVAESGQTLPPRVLSSGEKQLLLVFCSLLIAGDLNGIFIVDEPELSLNVKWQRQLTTALLRFTADASTQFVLATHSIELLARHRENVVRLRHIGERDPR